jgi:3'-5' exoribonuclease
LVARVVKAFGDSETFGNRTGTPKLLTSFATSHTHNFDLFGEFLMSRQSVGDLRDGDSVDEIYLVADKQLRANRHADLYLLAQLRDKTGTISGLMWNVTEEQCSHYDAGSFVRARGKVQLYQGGLQLILTRVDHVDPSELDLEDFELAPRQDVQALLARMKEILLGINDPALEGLMACFINDEALMTKMTQTGAGVKAHHAYPGGLVEHITNMLEVALRIEDLYPDVNFSLLLAGIFLHDLGKVREMDFEHSFVYTDEGQLLGHMSIAVEMVSEKVRAYEMLHNAEFPNEWTLRLKHMILSHHGSYAHGSSRLPMTPEAIALHHLDNLDAKIHEFARTIEEDPSGDSNWTPYLPRIERKLFKGVSKTTDE